MVEQKPQCQVFHSLPLLRHVSYDIPYEPCHAKTVLKIFVFVLPKVRLKLVGTDYRILLCCLHELYFTVGVIVGVIPKEGVAWLVPSIGISMTKILKPAFVRRGSYYNPFSGVIYLIIPHGNCIPCFTPLAVLRAQVHVSPPPCLMVTGDR